VDFVFAGSGQDVVIGGEGLDTLSGEYGDDRMFGGAGPDQMIGDAGDDILNGGIGGQNQTLNVDECLGEFGYNLVSFSDVTIPLNRIADLNFQNVNMGTSTPFGQLWVNMQGVEGSPSADQIIGDAGNNWLIGGGQNDFISGGAGDDVIVADSMRLDTLIGTYGANGKLQENGILDAIKAGDGKHFQDLLRSVPNFRFGDIATVGPSDLTYRASANGLRRRHEGHLAGITGGYLGAYANAASSHRYSCDRAEPVSDLKITNGIMSISSKWSMETGDYRGRGCAEWNRCR
jgi:Ca2+-binding RTX toxin-like protein